MGFNKRGKFSALSKSRKLGKKEKKTLRFFIIPQK